MAVKLGKPISRRGAGAQGTQRKAMGKDSDGKMPDNVIEKLKVIKFWRTTFFAITASYLVVAFILLAFNFPGYFDVYFFFLWYLIWIFSGWRYFNCKCPGCDKSFGFILLPWLKRCFKCKLPLDYKGSMESTIESS